MQRMLLKKKKCPTVISFLPTLHVCAHTHTHNHNCWLGNGQWLMSNSYKEYCDKDYEAAPWINGKVF